jgi:hypothetical protein
MEGEVAIDEHCLSCGRDTAAGTELFASRKRGLDRQTGAEGHLCYACQPGSASGGAEQSIPVSGRYAVVDIGGIPQG